MNFKKNWKTTVAGVAIAIVAGLSALHLITPDQASSLTAVLAAFGLSAAKDGDKTGV